MCEFTLEISLFSEKSIELLENSFVGDSETFKNVVNSHETIKGEKIKQIYKTSGFCSLGLEFLTIFVNNLEFVLKLDLCNVAEIEYVKLKTF